MQHDSCSPARLHPMSISAIAASAISAVRTPFWDCANVTQVLGRSE